MGTPILSFPTPAAATNAGPPERHAAAPLRRVAEEFEAVFLAQMLASMTRELGGDGIFFGGGEGDPFRGMLNDEIAKLISHSGGIGLADAVLREMLKVQEVA